jgi:hypothetical protein
MEQKIIIRSYYHRLENKLAPTYDLMSRMPKTAFANIEPFQSYSTRTDILVIRIKGFYPSIIGLEVEFVIG